MELEDDALAKAVFFLSTTETRSKVYRLLQYGAKVSKWGLFQLWTLDASAPATTQHATSSTSALCSDSQPNGVLVTAAPSTEQTTQSKHSKADRRRWVIACLSRAELVFGDARRLFRFLQFLEMVDMYRHVCEPVRVVRVLRRLRILCFFFFYLSENYVVFLTRVLGVSPRDSLMRRMKRGCNGFWLLSILLAFPLDHLLHRGSLLSMVKKLLDLPVAYVAFSGERVSDGLFGALGLASANIGVYTRWLDVMVKFRQQNLKLLGAVPDVA